MLNQFSNSFFFLAASIRFGRCRQPTLSQMASSLLLSPLLFFLTIAACCHHLFHLRLFFVDVVVQLCLIHLPRAKCQEIWELAPSLLERIVTINITFRWIEWWNGVTYRLFIVFMALQQEKQQEKKLSRWSIWVLWLFMIQTRRMKVLNGWRAKCQHTDLIGDDFTRATYETIQTGTHKLGQSFHMNRLIQWTLHSQPVATFLTSSIIRLCFSLRRSPFHSSCYRVPFIALPYIYCINFIKYNRMIRFSVVSAEKWFCACGAETLILFAINKRKTPTKCDAKKKTPPIHETTEQTFFSKQIANIYE